MVSQIKNWCPLLLIVFLGSPFGGADDQPSKWIKAARLYYHGEQLYVVMEPGPESPLRRWKDVHWNDLHRLQDVFTKLCAADKWEEQTITKALDVLRGLVNLDFYE